MYIQFLFNLFFIGRSLTQEYTLEQKIRPSGGLPPKHPSPPAGSEDSPTQPASGLRVWGQNGEGNCCRTFFVPLNLHTASLPFCL